MAFQDHLIWQLVIHSMSSSCVLSMDYAIANAAFGIPDLAIELNSKFSPLQHFLVWTMDHLLKPEALAMEIQCFRDT